MFYFEQGIDWHPLITLTERNLIKDTTHQEIKEKITFYKDILEMVGVFAAKEIAPFADEIEKTGVQFSNGEVEHSNSFSNILKHFHALSIQAATMPRELGGMQCPTIVYGFITEILARADISLITQSSLNILIIEALLQLSIYENSTTFDHKTGKLLNTRWDEAIREIIKGEACGAMDITEANAGSDMASLRTVAQKDDYGNWRLTGEKIFITSGNEKYHLVLARSEDQNTAPGLKGLSLFFVQAFTTDNQGMRKRHIQIERVEKKLGQHASPTCVVTFDNTPAEIIGKRGEGFLLMLRLMNNARIGVGFVALGIAENAYRLAKTYAAERTSMGKTIDQHEIIADYLDEAASNLQIMRALTFDAAYHEEMAVKLEAKIAALGDNNVDTKHNLLNKLNYHKLEARHATPLVKYFAAEKAVEITRYTMQILGGVGYTCDYQAERLLRDALVFPIYEGTSQIQALMAMKDCLMGIIRRPKTFLHRLAKTRWRSISARDNLERRVAHLVNQSLKIQQYLVTKTFTAKIKTLANKPLRSWSKSYFQRWDPKHDFTYASLHAERLAKILIDARAAEILLMHAKKQSLRSEVLERHLERAELRVRYLSEQIKNTGQRLLSQLHK